MLVELAGEVVREMRAEGRRGVVFNAQASRFDYDGVDDFYRKDVEEAESRYGLKLQKLREEQVVANAKKHGYTVKKRVEVDGKVKVVLRRRVYA